VSAKKKSTKPGRAAAIEPLALDAPLGEAVARLVFAAPQNEAPSPRVKEQLLARVRGGKGGTGAPGRPELPAAAEAAWRFSALGADEDWAPLPLPGVRLRELAIDRERDTALLYIVMAPGARFPDHVHSAPERGLVLTGDFQMSDRLLRAGDFYEAGAGTRHERLSSPSGCTGLLWVGAAAWERWRAAAVAR